MNPLVSKQAAAILTAIAMFSAAGTALAQVAGGSTTLEATVTASTQLAMGWSAKKSLMGKSLYNEAGQKVGKVEDLIISPNKDVSYVIVGAGGFVGIGRHDVAVPVSQIQNQAGKLVMAGATKASIKALPTFTYATDTGRREAFMAAADKDMAKGRAAAAGLQKKAAAASAEAKARMDLDISALETDLKSAEAKLLEMKRATAAGWHEFEADVNAATARVRKSTDKALG